MVFFVWDRRLKFDIKTLPNNKSNYLHEQNRKLLPGKCNEVIKILSNKSLIMDLTPLKWRPNI